MCANMCVVMPSCLIGDAEGAGGGDLSCVRDMSGRGGGGMQGGSYSPGSLSEGMISTGGAAIGCNIGVDALAGCFGFVFGVEGGGCACACA
jgi:hypothetical protein